MDQNLRGYLFGDERGRHFCVVAAAFDEAVAAAVEVLRARGGRWSLPRYQGLSWSLPGVYAHALRGLR
jgi:hypothetical protein